MARHVPGCLCGRACLQRGAMTSVRPLPLPLLCCGIFCVGLRPERPADCDRECWDLMNRCWHGEPMLRPHVGELEISLRAIYDRFATAAAQLPQTTSSDDGASSRPASSSNGDFTEIDVNESLTTDSDFDFEDLTLQ